MKSAFMQLLRCWYSPGRRFFGLLLGLCLATCPVPGLAAGFVYETPTEFLASGDFNGDGILDVLVLDKLTGNVRVGYADANGQLTWAGPASTGDSLPAALAVGRFFDSGRDAIAVTSAELNQVNLVDLSDANNVPTPVAVYPTGVGLGLLTSLAAPYGAIAPLDYLLTGANDASIPGGGASLELYALTAGPVSTLQDSRPSSGPLARGNPLQPGDTLETLAAMIQRGTNDQFLAYSPNSAFAQVLSKTNLPAGSDYALGIFAGETMPRLCFYVPGQSNLILQTLTGNAGLYDFGPEQSLALPEEVRLVAYVPNGLDGLFLIQYDDGVQALTFSAGVPSLAAPFQTGVAPGSLFSGVVPLADGRFALLDAPSDNGGSGHAQMVGFSGGNYAVLSSSDLVPVTKTTSRANVWVFQGEPFVSRTPGLLASLNAADWSLLVNGLPAGLSVISETDGGPGVGLGSDVTRDLGAPPVGTVYALAQQYREDISLFSYSSPQPPAPVSVTLTPPPGLYSDPINVTLVPQPAGSAIYYRVRGSGWLNYAGPFPLSADGTIDYYGVSSPAGARSRLESARYTFAQGGITPPTTPLTVAPADTNAVPPYDPGIVPISATGTLFYGRKADTNLTIWSINLDGTGERLLTTGSRPRASRDGHWLAFLRSTRPPADNYGIYGDIWLRDLFTGQESMVYSNTTSIIGLDWDRTGSLLYFDNGCNFKQVDLSGNVTPLTFPSQCSQYAPVVSQVDGRLAFFSENPNSLGLLLTSPDLAAVSHLQLNVAGARWPSWSPDGAHLSLVDQLSSGSIDAGRNIYLTGTNGTQLSQITALVNTGDGFPHGTLWSPAGDALIGAGTILGTNGLWVIPLTADLTACDCQAFPTRLPTSAGDPIDFAGTIVVAPSPAPEIVRAPLAIRLDPAGVVVYWGTNFVNYTLEATLDLASPIWVSFPGPYSISASGYYLEHLEPLAGLATARYFRLRYTGP